jgi:ATP-dependent DNA helicase DinG
MLSEPDEFLSERGPLAMQIEDYSVRPMQQQMAVAVAQALADHSSLICEAGTGTGKTYAYLVPSLFAGKKIIISTGTRHLQDQLYFKDLPVIARAAGVPVRSALLKGRNNYLCRYRLRETERDGRSLTLQQHGLLNTIRSWVAQTESGDLTELADLQDHSPFKLSITSTTENCLGQECEFYDDCFVFRARKQAAEADLVIVNHHLLLADLALRESGFGEVLPKADSIIFDEAHQLPDLAAEFFSESLSSRQITELSNDSRLAQHNDAPDVQGFNTILDKLHRAVQDLRLALGRGDRRSAWQELVTDTGVSRAVPVLAESLTELEQALDPLAQRSRALDNCWRRCGNLMHMLAAFREREQVEMVQWVETRGGGFLLHQTPLDVSRVFQERIARHECNCIFTSATLAVETDFNHFSSQLGLAGVRALSWPSPFDFAHQSLLYLPPDMPEPADPSYIAHVVTVALSVIKASGGHAFVLFTSHRALKEAASLIMNGTDYPVLVQGDAGKTGLLETFRKTPHAILLGTASFWEGVDVRGEALSSVIIDKLPFAPPDDPVFRARAARMQEEGRNPFMEYQVPQAIISLKQGVGRLIRDRQDYGVMVICDPRLRSRPYGRKFLGSLPAMPVTHAISDVERFYSTRRAATPAIV